MRDGEVGLAATVDWPEAGDAQLLLAAMSVACGERRMDRRWREFVCLVIDGTQCASNWRAPIASRCAWSVSTARCC
jgi:hypothetical protein